MSTDIFERGVWVIVCSQGKFYVGFVNRTVISEDRWIEIKEEIIEEKVLELEEAVEMVLLMGTVRGENGAPKVVQNVLMQPIGLASEPTRLFVRPNSIQFFWDLSEETRKNYEKQYEILLGHLQRERAKEAGLIVPPTIVAP